MPRSCEQVSLADLHLCVLNQTPSFENGREDPCRNFSIEKGCSRIHFTLLAPRLPLVCFFPAAMPDIVSAGPLCCHFLSFLQKGKS